MADALAGPVRTADYRRLPEGMFASCNPEPFRAPRLYALNTHYLETLGLDSEWFAGPAGLDFLSGARPLATDSSLAMAYAGHQFAHWVPLLGDGRAHMIGQLVLPDGRLLDLQLKGSGRTPFSRGGDGRATLGAVMREYLVSEAMAGLGIPTTRALAIVTTGEDVRRESIQPGAILVRAAESHLRVGSFQHADSNLGPAALTSLADYVIARHYPELGAGTDAYAGLLSAVIERQARLIAQWMLAGFIHGVMNTDNTSVVGETIDFGPCAFLDEFNPAKVFSSIDRQGRYAWDRQPGIAQWNLAQLAGSLLGILAADRESAIAIARERLEAFVPTYNRVFLAALQDKLGLDTDQPENEALALDTLQAMAGCSADFTCFFDTLTRVAGGADPAQLSAVLGDAPQQAGWLARWQAGRNPAPATHVRMRAANPVVIARNHRVEAAITAACEHDDPLPFQQLAAALRRPFREPEQPELADPPRPAERVHQTFCGT